MVNFIVWAGNCQTLFEKYEDAIKYAKKINKRNKYPAKILRKTVLDSDVATWQEIHY